MRTVFLGTSDFAVAVLRALAGSAHAPALVVTRPDRRRGRGQALSPPPVAVAAAELGIDVDQPASVNEEAARERIAAARPEAAVVCAFGALIGDELLGAHEWLNVHPSLLPRWRGAAPIERAIEAGDGLTGVCIMRPVAELDAGPVLLAEKEPIEPGDDFGTLSARLAALAGRLLVRALDERPGAVAQAEEGVTYAERIERAERLLAPDAGAEALERRVRAFHPHVGTYVEPPGGPRLGVERARVVDAPGPPAGELEAREGRLLYGTDRGALELLAVRPPGGRTMDAEAFLRGRGGALGG